MGVISIQFHQITLYFVVLASSTFVFLIALGGIGIFSGNWTRDVFNLICHQDLNRTIQVDGLYMSVCARCIGIYSSLAIFWLLMPLMVSIFGNVKIKFAIKLLVAILALNIFDVIGNHFEFWSNTNTSRFMAGFLIGASVVLILKNEFFKKIKN